MLDCLLRREYQPAALLAQNPPVFGHALKRLIFDLACPTSAVHHGAITVTRWSSLPLPTSVDLAMTEILGAPGFYDYAGSDVGVWHVNFADPRLFVAYGSPLLAQDELQAAEHPLLGCIREALIAEQVPAVTCDTSGPTPFLVAGVERRCQIAIGPDARAGRPYGLYGNRFAQASTDAIRKAVYVNQPPKHSNLIAIAAPTGGPGPYFLKEIENVLVTAYTGFAAAVQESRRIWPQSPCEVRTGFWGCGAFGGNRQLMTLLQLLAARLAGVSRLKFHFGDPTGETDFRAGETALQNVLSAGSPGEPFPHLLERVADLDYEWGVGDGN